MLIREKEILNIQYIDKMSEINFKADSSNFEKQINETIQWFKEN